MTEPFSTIATTVVTKQVLTSLVSKSLITAFKGLRTVSDSVVESFTDQFVGYIERQREKHSFLNTLVFQNQVSLEQLYIPLTIKNVVETEENSQSKIRINSFRKELIPTQKRVLITDTAGMGKSTLMKYLLVQCIKSGFAIPIFIELRHLSQTQTILSLIERELNLDRLEETPHFTIQRISRLLKKGNLVFFLDGYDEISFKDREAVTKDIKNFFDIYPKNFIVITSRPESGLAAFPSFVQFKIAPLTKKESYELIRKYDSFGKRAEQLIDKLEGQDLKSVHEFLKSPLLTSLLYRCFEYKQNVPAKKHIFYRQVFDALYDWHDASKDGYNTREKKSKLDLDSFHRVLRVVGFISTMNGEIEGEKDKVLGWIRDAKQVCVGLSFSESAFLEDITCAVPVFAQDGLFYKWSHKSLAEYFAAQYICTEGKDQQEQVFSHIINCGYLEKFENMLDQIYDSDIGVFRKYFSLPMAKAFMRFRETSYGNLDPLIPNEQIEFRREVTFASRYMIPLGRFADANVISEGMKVFSRNPEIESTVFIHLPSSTIKNEPQFIFSTPEKFSTIVRILKNKKDPLAKSHLKIDLNGKKNQLPNNVKKGFYDVTDDPECICNTKENFDSVTNFLVARQAALIVDSDECQKFCDNFVDEAKRESFTTSMLKNIISSNKKSEDKS